MNRNTWLAMENVRKALKIHLSVYNNRNIRRPVNEEMSNLLFYLFFASVCHFSSA